MLRELKMLSLAGCLLWPTLAQAQDQASSEAERQLAPCPGASADALPELANDNVRLRLVEAAEGFRLEAENLRHAAVEMLVSRADALDQPERSIILPPLSTMVLMLLEGSDKQVVASALNDAWRFTSYMGDPASMAPDDSYLYRLPFREGESYRLVQGYGGKRSHQSETSYYALDFQLEVGEPVYAARAGLVVRAVDWFCRAGDRSLINQSNLIVIQHDDGTLGNYAHLNHRGVLVEEGERVERGQHIGYSGNTGFTRGPHLHFVVRRERDIAIPVQFEGYEGADLTKRGRFRVP